ncbi:MAG: Ig-like domain-containing protein [Candidatus Atribacteria bacterium]|nr:Ig-like domain-containing protein [Candidatus Atribacteria bacterium]
MERKRAIHLIIFGVIIVIGIFLNGYPVFSLNESVAHSRYSDNNLQTESPVNELPSFLKLAITKTSLPDLPGMGQIISDFLHSNSIPIPSLSEILTYPINLEGKDQLPSLSPTKPTMPGLSTPPIDSNPPQVTLTFPNSGAVEVPMDVQIKIQFDEPIQPGPTFHTIALNDQYQKSVLSDIEIQDTLLLLKPGSNLETKTTYQVILPYQSLMDNYGNTLLDTFIFSFTTIVPPPVSTVSLPFLGGKLQETIKVPVYFNGSQKTAHIEMVLTFNPDLLEFLEITPGEINNSWQFSAETMNVGKIRLNIFQSKELKLTKDNGTIAVLKFRVIDKDKTLSQSELILEELKLLDQDEAILPGKVISGRFYLVGSEIDSSSVNTETSIPIPTTIPIEVELADMMVEPSSLLNGKVGKEYVFKAVIDNIPASVKSLKYQWNFGDKSKVVDSSVGEMTHIFSQPGKYEVTVKAFDRSKGRMIAMKKLKVEILQEPLVTTTINTPESQTKVFNYQEKYPNGKLKVQYTYILLPDGTQVKNGLENSWYENGKKKNEGEYQNGKKVGVWISCYDNGVIGQKGTYQNGQKSGLWVKNYRNGNKESEGHYQNNLREGAWKKWYENGELWADFEYKHDQIVPGSYLEY